MVHNSVKSGVKDTSMEAKLSRKALKAKELEEIAVLGFNPHSKISKEEKKKQAQPDLYIDIRAQRKNSTFVDNPDLNTCDHYLLAAEESRLGWFWMCPNGGDCAYRHALPEGLELSKRVYTDEEPEDTRTLEEIIDERRENLQRDEGVKITLEIFMTWKAMKLDEEAKQRLKDEHERNRKVKAGKLKETGKEIFMKNIAITDEGEAEDDEAFDLTALRRQKQEEENIYDIEAAAKANSDITIAFDRGSSITVMAAGKEVTIDPSLYILDGSVPEISDLE